MISHSEANTAFLTINEKQRHSQAGLTHWVPRGLQSAPFTVIAIVRQLLHPGGSKLFFLVVLFVTLKPLIHAVALFMYPQILG